MSADRELLELAAKAAGIALYWAEDDPECDWVQGTYPRVPDHKILEKWTWKIWDPLTDDGDALRLAVKLEISFQVRNGATWVKWAEPDGWPFLHHEVHDGDPHAATRRVIVRAAAEIGRSLPASAHDAWTPDDTAYRPGGLAQPAPRKPLTASKNSSPGQIPR